uniref:Uncharacterized protein n=1 Tax=Trichuris muris TaxID=70415 RepID=A0A5S6Q7S0_TRIMR
MVESRWEELTDEDLLNLHQESALEDELHDDEEPTNKNNDFSQKDFEEVFSMVESLKQKLMYADPDIDRSMQVRRQIDDIFLPYLKIYENHLLLSSAIRSNA